MKLREEFGDVTKHFDLEDWRTVRTPYYWKSDQMDKVDAWKHKLKLVRHYDKTGTVIM